MGDSFQRVALAVSPVVHRVDAPVVSCPVMCRVPDAIHQRVPHQHVRVSHVNLCPQDMLAVYELAGFHPTEQVEVVLDGTFAEWTVGAGLVDRAAVGLQFLRRLTVDVSLALHDQPLGILKELLEPVRSVVQLIPLEAQPADVVLNRVDVFDVFFRRVRVVKPQVASAVVFFCQPEVQTDRFGVPDVQIAIRLGRESRVDSTVVFSLGEIFLDDLFDEVEARFVLGVFVIGIGWSWGGIHLKFLGTGRWFRPVNWERQASDQSLRFAAREMDPNRERVDRRLPPRRHGPKIKPAIESAGTR